MTQGDFHLGFTLQTLADKGVHVSFHKMLIYEGVVGFSWDLMGLLMIIDWVQ